MCNPKENEKKKKKKKTLSIKTSFECFISSITDHYLYTNPRAHTAFASPVLSHKKATKAKNQQKKNQKRKKKQQTHILLYI